jgi:hypothetical protein
MLLQNLLWHFLFLAVHSVPHSLPYFDTLAIPAGMYKSGVTQYVTFLRFLLPQYFNTRFVFLTYSLSRYLTHCRWGKYVTPLCEQLRSKM